jgi:ParB family transcriptional regulator, chromosome partitioning protein
MIKNDNNIVHLDISKLKPFTDFPFNLEIEDSMQALSSSIKTNGLIEPIIVRPLNNDKQFTHEIVSGHRRVVASKLAELTDIKCDIRSLDRNQAIIYMVDSALTNRKEPKPSEKAKAYKMRLDALKSQGKRTDLTSRQVGEKLTSVAKVSVESNDSPRQVQRYIRLTNLIPSLIKKLDERKIAFTPCVELSYLSSDEQTKVFSILDAEQKFNLPLSVATKLKNISQYGNLTSEKIFKLVKANLEKQPKNYKLPYSSVNKYFNNDATPNEINSTIDNALTEWRKNHPLKTTKPKKLER